ncbi:hypothetical protein VCHENC02_1287, partial [Vibrio harveyi]
MLVKVNGEAIVRLHFSPFLSLPHSLY